MVGITISMKDETYIAVLEYAKEHNCSTSAAVRELIKMGLQEITDEKQDNNQ